jgi:hypothetical protein
MITILNMKIPSSTKLKNKIKKEDDLMVLII